MGEQKDNSKVILENCEEPALSFNELMKQNKIMEERIENIKVKHGEYTNADLLSIDYDKIYFIGYSETGAMGIRDNLVTIGLGNHEIEKMETCFMDGIFNVKAFFEHVKGLESILFCGGREVNGIGEGWKHIYMGCGNHLLVRKSIYEQFIVLSRNNTAEEMAL